MPELNPDVQSPSSPMSQNPEILSKESPPLTPPSPDATEEIKLSRKREREVSLEPVTTPKAVIDFDPLRQEHKETRTPAKKNRIHLDSTQEEEDIGSRSRSNSNSPPLTASPRQEMKIKVRQISQGVEDLSWRNSMKPTSEGEIELDSEITTLADNGEGDIDTIAADAPTPAAPSDIKIDDDEVPPTSSPNSQPSDSVMDVPPDDSPSSANDSPNKGFRDTSSRRGSESDGAERDKGLKRKFLERGTSQGPQENGDASEGTNVEHLKRPRDDADKDVNPRETKRPTPPPESEPEEKVAPPPAPKLSGFMAYASTSSPFASVKGQNIFSSASKVTPSPPPFSPSPPPTTFTPFSVGLGESSSSVPTATKRTGFEAFAASSSPFVSATRSKSPVLGSKLNRNKSPPRRTNSANVNAFSAYATGGAQGFSIPVPKRARAGSPNGGSSRSSVERTSTASAFGSNEAADSGAEDEADDRPISFGEKLRAGKDDDEDARSDDEQSKVMLTEQDFTTGEEDEETIHQVRGKLFSLGGTSQWKERGTGTLKLNVRRSDGGGARLVMRKEAVYTVLLNVTLFHGMRCVLAQDPRYLRFSVIEEGVTTHYNLRVSSAKIAMELMEEINANIPSA